MANLIAILNIATDGPRAIVTPCGVINKGINNAARFAGAAFAIQFTLVYPKGGVHLTKTPIVNITDTKQIANFGPSDVSFEIAINLGGDNVDANSHIGISAQIVHRTPNGDEPVGEPYVGSFDI